MCPPIRTPDERSVNYIDEPVRIFVHNLQYLILAVCTEQLLAFQGAGIQYCLAYYSQQID